MICPRCDEGLITTVCLKSTKKEAYLCNFCETLWVENEPISMDTGRPVDTLSYCEDREYTRGESENIDQEHRDTRYLLSK